METSENEASVALTSEEARVLGCLLEKEATTPDIYPLSINALLSACNQKTNRNPVVDYEEDLLAEALEGLREKALIYRVDGAGSRVPKYKHRIEERLGLDGAGKALLAVLLLRGPQTVGELRVRTERMHPFVDLEAVESALTEIAEDCEVPLWKKLDPTPGQKEVRYAHLFFGDIELSASAQASVANEAPLSSLQARNERMAHLEARVADLESELQAMREAFHRFRDQFE